MVQAGVIVRALGQGRARWQPNGVGTILLGALRGYGFTQSAATVLNLRGVRVDRGERAAMLAVVPRASDVGAKCA